jgi:hypothetical protein
MTYIPDGASKDYRAGEHEWFFAFGWLDSNHSFRAGWEDVHLKSRVLEALSELPVTDKYRGWHIDKGLGLNHKTEPYPNGSRKFTYDDTVYTAPNAVLYYIRELDYKPPDEVIDAIIEKTND